VQVVDFVDAKCRAGLHPAADLQSALVVARFLPLETARRADCRSCERVFVTVRKTCTHECAHGTQECVRHIGGLPARMSL
jgi:hypothetical protein